MQALDELEGARARLRSSISKTRRRKSSPGHRSHLTELATKQRHEGRSRRDDRLCLQHGLADRDVRKARAFLEPALRSRRAPKRLARRIEQVPMDRLMVWIDGE